MKGLSFKPDMRRAIEEGRKTVTRRLAGLELANINPNDWYLEKTDGRLIMCDRLTGERKGVNESGEPYDFMCRFRPGETVYVKEAWQCAKNPNGGWDKSSIMYKADISASDLADEACDWEWESPLFMPQWAARTFLLITDVRPERLHDIEKEKDGYVNEGYKQPFEASLDFAWYEYLWDSINPKAKWATSPWVWRIEFEAQRSLLKC